MPFSPRRWWPGPLDVERLAWEAVDDARTAVRRLVEARGQRWRAESSPALVAASFAAIEHLRVDGREPEGWAPLSGFVAAADGWVRLHANYPHHAAAIGRALGATDRPGLERTVARMPADQVEDAVTRAGGIAVRVRTPEQWRAHAHGAATARDGWTTVDECGEGRSLDGGGLPLDGVRVLDLTRVVAGPTCAQLLGCLGADVLRIDPPDRPELLDQHLSTGMGKRSAVVDLADHGADVERLLRTADVVLLGYRPGSLARYGLDPHDLLDRHPHLVVGSLSAWGERGPWAHRPGFDSIVQAATGIATICGSAAGRPGSLPVQALDHATGHRLAAGVLDLVARGRSGIVRTSLLGAARTLLALPPPPAGERAALPVTRATVASPHGALTVVPTPLALDGDPLVGPVSAYGMAGLTWR